MYLAVLLISNMHQGQWLANKLNFQKIIGFPTLNTEIQKIFWLEHEKIAKNRHFRVGIFKYLSTKYSEKMAKCHQRASKMANYHQRNTKITRKHKKCWQNTQCQSDLNQKYTFWQGVNFGPFFSFLVFFCEIKLKNCLKMKWISPKQTFL